MDGIGDQPGSVNGGKKGGGDRRCEVVEMQSERGRVFKCGRQQWGRTLRTAVFIGRDRCHVEVCGNLKDTGLTARDTESSVAIQGRG